jgi:hypothetical protein
MCACMSSYSQVYQIHRPCTASTKRPTPSSSSSFAAGVSWTLLTCSRRRIAPHLSGASFLHGTFSRDRAVTYPSPGCTSATRGMRCRGTARAFARGKTHFSQCLTAVGVNVFLAVQRVCFPPRSHSHDDWVVARPPPMGGAVLLPILAQCVWIEESNPRPAWHSQARL